MSARPETFPCPACGEDVPAKAKACPDCGACEKSGWSEDAAADGLGLPDEEFDYDAFVAEEWGNGPRKTRAQWLWWLIAVLVLIAFVAVVIGAGR